jgi:chromosome partitioning protein
VNGTVNKVIAIFNQSGGVSKSTLTMNLGYQLTQLKQKILLVDLDPQASLTVFMGLEPADLEKTVYEAILIGEPLPVHCHIHQMDLAPANINLSGAELELVVADMREIRLREALSPVQSQYDFILIDCPPSLGILSYIGLVAATHVLIPIQTQYKALKGTELLLKTISRVQSRANRTLKIAGIVPTLHDSRTVQGDLSLQTIEEQLSKVGVIYPAIPRSVAFADAVQEHLPLALYNPKHPAVKLLIQIAKGLKSLP